MCGFRKTNLPAMGFEEKKSNLCLGAVVFRCVPTYARSAYQVKFVFVQSGTHELIISTKAPVPRATALSHLSVIYV